MSDSLTHLPPIRQKERYTSAITGRTNIIEYNSVKMHVLEMEDVLFHLASAMMMPKKPAGTSSSQGTGNPSGSAQASNQDQQAALSGIEALALAFKQLEFNPNLKTLLAAHADTSGDVQYNFPLSLDRGRNVHALLVGSENDWVASVASSANPNVQPDRHKIEDYQQVLTWASVEKLWACDPKGIDNTWGTKTENAVKAFLSGAGKETLLAENPEVVFNDIKNHPRKLWPESALRVIYRLYNEKITRMLGETPAGMERRRQALRGSFLHPNIPIVPCGEAFPIDASERNSYRSQQNRRVEVIFFDREDLVEFTPAMLDAQCPLEMKKKITSGTLGDYKTKCPIWPYRKHFAPLYIDPRDLYAVMFHMQFLYYDKIKNARLPVPEGLSIKTFRANGDEIPTVTQYTNGIYSVKVQFKEQDHTTPPNDFCFKFKKEKAWIFTENGDAGTNPKIMTETDIAAAAGKPFADLTFVERLHYYDIPSQWSSRHYWTRYNADFSKGSWFDDTVKNKLKLKPFGGTFSDTAKPLVFSLDDMILTDENLTPIAWVPDNTPANRIAVYCQTFSKTGPCAADLSDVGLYKSDSANKRDWLTQHAPDITDKNYIYDYPLGTRLIIAKGNYFDVFDRRHADGARAALRWIEVTKRQPPSTIYELNAAGTAFNVCTPPNDVPVPGHAITPRPTCYANKFFILQPFYEQHHLSGSKGALSQMGIGRCDFLLLRCCGIDNNKELAIHLHFHKYWFDFSDAKLPDNLHADAAKQLDWVSIAAKNVMKRWNGPDSPYQNDTVRIEPLDAAQPITIRTIKLVQVSPDVAVAHFKINVIKDCRANMGSQTGISQFAPGENKPEAGGRLTSAHETGHGYSLGDEYIESSTSASYYTPGFFSYSPGAPYVFDENAMMNANKEIRTRYFWNIAEWLRSIDAGREYQVVHGTYKYELPHHPQAPLQSYENFPLVQKNDLANGVHGKCDLFLYRLGKDWFSQEGFVAGHKLDGILVIVVKIKITYHTDNYAEVWNATYNINNEINTRFNKRSSGAKGVCYASGRTGAPGNLQFDKCPIVISSRFLVTNFKDDNTTLDYAKSVQVYKEKNNTVPSPPKIYDPVVSKAAYTAQVNTIETTHKKHFEIVVSRAASGAGATWDAANNFKLNVTCVTPTWYTEIAGIIGGKFHELLGMSSANNTADYRTIASNVFASNSNVMNF